MGYVPSGKTAAIFIFQLLVTSNLYRNNTNKFLVLENIVVAVRMFSVTIVYNQIYVWVCELVMTSPLFGDMYTGK